VGKAVSAGRAVVIALAGLALRTTATTGVGQLPRGGEDGDDRSAGRSVSGV